MPRSNTSRKLYASFGSMLLLLLALAFISALTFQRMADADERNEHSHAVISVVQELLTSLIDMETGARGYMLAGKSEFLEPFKRGQKDFKERYRDALQLTSDNPAYQQQLSHLNQLQLRWVRSYLPVIEQRSRTNITNTEAFLPGASRRRRYVEQMRLIIGDIEDYELGLLQQRAKEKANLRRLTQIALLCGGGLAILLAVSLSTLLAGSTQKLVRTNERLEQEMAERELAQRKLQESELYFRSLTDNAQDLITVLNFDGTIRYMSPSIDRILGYQPEEMQGKPVFEYVHPDDLPRLTGVYHDIISGSGERRYSEYLFHHKDGSWRTLECISKYIADPVVQGVVTNSRDVTERKQIERIKNEFISTVSHELRTPLTSIRGSLGLIAGGVVGELPPKALTMIDIAHKNSERLVRLVNDILDIEKIESGKMEFRMEPLELVPLIERALRDNQAYAGGFDVTFHFGSTPAPAQVGEPIDEPLKVNGDSDRLLQLMANLLSNATKFSPRGETVTVSVAHPDGDARRVRVSIADRGPGIPLEFRSRIFQKFAQADASDTRQKGGTGLGLSISKAIVEKHDGRIGYTTTPGEGTTLYFDLPVYAPATETESATVLPSAPIATNGKPRPRILICEDDHDVATLLEMLLQQNGIDCDIAYDAAEAKEFLASRSYNGMTVDIRLPDQDGISLIRDLREQPATRDLPIVVVSAEAEAGRAAFNGDAVSIIDWLSKPIDVERLVAAAKHAAYSSSGRNGRRPKVLHIEDDPDVLQVVATILQDTAEVTPALNLQEARDVLEQIQFDLIVLDLDLPDGTGTQLLAMLHDRQPPVPVIIFSASELGSDMTQRVAAALTKSRTSNQEFLHTIQALLRRDQSTPVMKKEEA